MSRCITSKYINNTAARRDVSLLHVPASMCTAARMHGAGSTAAGQPGCVVSRMSALGNLYLVQRELCGGEGPHRCQGCWRIWLLCAAALSGGGVCAGRSLPPAGDAAVWLARAGSGGAEFGASEPADQLHISVPQQDRRRGDARHRRAAAAAPAMRQHRLPPVTSDIWLRSGQLVEPG